MSYVDFDDKIENEIITLSHLKKNKNNDSYYGDYIYLDEEDEEDKKESEKLKNESLKLYYRIDEGKNKELESTFKESKLNIKSKNLIKLGKGKFIQIREGEFIIYENKCFNKLFNIKIEKDFDKILSIIELDNNDIIFLALNNNDYKLQIYRLKDNKYSLLQEIEENSKGYNQQYSYHGCHKSRKDYIMEFLEKLSGNKFISISNYGIKIYSLNKNQKYSLDLMDVYMDGELKIFEIIENQLIFCVKKHYGDSMGGPAHDYIKIDKVEIENITKSEKEEFLNEEEDNYDFNMKDLKDIIPSPKLKSSYKCLFEYSTRKGKHTLSDSITLNNKFFLIFIDNHLLIFNLINFELIKRYTFLENGVNNLYNKNYYYNYNIQKWKKSNENEFLIILKDNITLLELTEKNKLNEKITLDLKIIGYTYLPFSDYSSLVKLDEEKRFYIEKNKEILFY